MRSAWRKASVLRGATAGAVCSEKAALLAERAAGVLHGRPRGGGGDPHLRGTTELRAGTALGGDGCAAGLKSLPAQRVGTVSGASLRCGSVEPHRAVSKEVQTEGHLLEVAGGAQGPCAAARNSVCTPKVRCDGARDAQAHGGTVDSGVGCRTAGAARVDGAEARLASLGAKGFARAIVIEPPGVPDSGSGDAEECGTLRRWRIWTPFGRSERQPVGTPGQGADCASERTASTGILDRVGASLALGQGGEQAGRASRGRHEGMRPRAVSRCGQARRGGPERWERQGGRGRQVRWPQGVAMLAHRARLRPSEGTRSSPGVVAVHCGAAKQPDDCNPGLPVGRLREVWTRKSGAAQAIARAGLIVLDSPRIRLANQKGRYV